MSSAWHVGFPETLRKLNTISNFQLQSNVIFLVTMSGNRLSPFLGKLRQHFLVETHTFGSAKHSKDTQLVLFIQNGMAHGFQFTAKTAVSFQITW